MVDDRIKIKKDTNRHEKKYVGALDKLKEREILNVGIQINVVQR